MRSKGKRLQPDEWEYIRQHCITTSDQKIADKLNRDIVTITRARRKLGINKTNAGIIQNFKENSKVTDPNGIVLHASQKLTEQQRKEFFKTQLTNTLYYKKLKDQFTDEEMDFYMEEWGPMLAI